MASFNISFKEWCYKNLMTNMLDEWNYNKNGNFNPETIGYSSSQKIWWCCSKGHEWEAAIADRTGKRIGCPYCSGKRASKKWNLEVIFPDISKEWNYEKNSVSPNAVTPYSRKKVWWKCIKGHEWEAPIGNRTSNGTGCPVCNNRSTSFPEQAILYYCRQIFSEVNSRDTSIIGKELDIYIPEIKTAIEYDGIRWHSQSNSARIEQEKDSLCKENGIRLIRVIEIGLEHEHDKSVICLYKKKNNQKDLQDVIINLLSLITKKALIDVNIKRDQIQIREGYMFEPVDNNLSICFPEIAKQWDYEKNGALKPSFFSSGSVQKVWWKCSKNHSWETTIGSRTQGSGCPYCAGKLPSEDYNLQIIYPEIANEWDYEKNIGLTPNDVTPSSSKKIFWKCPNGHEYAMEIVSRTSKNCNCPYCSGRKVGYDNTLAANRPDLVQEWDVEYNGLKTPDMYTEKSAAIVGWICPVGHKYTARIGSRTRKKGTGCPVCNGKIVTRDTAFGTMHPELISLWNYEKNENLSPFDVMPKSSIKVWWKCSKGHEWQALVSNVANGSTCPYCSGKIARRIINKDTGEIYSNVEEASQKLCVGKTSIRNHCAEPDKKWQKANVMWKDF